jgi:hypothetical protein
VYQRLIKRISRHVGDKGASADAGGELTTVGPISGDHSDLLIVSGTGVLHG